MLLCPFSRNAPKKTSVRADILQELRHVIANGKEISASTRMNQNECGRIRPDWLTAERLCSRDRRALARLPGLRRQLAALALK